jgi:hypothetical protein
VRPVIERPPAIRVAAELQPLPAAVGLSVPDDEQQPEQAVCQPGRRKCWSESYLTVGGDTQPRPGFAQDRLQRLQIVAGQRLVPGIAADQRPDALPDVAGEPQVVAEIRVGLNRAGGAGIAQARVGQPGARLAGMNEHIGALVRVDGIHERLDEQQRHGGRLGLKVGGPRRQRHAVQASGHDRDPFLHRGRTSSCMTA